jgi:hypothetical protein
MNVMLFMGLLKHEFGADAAENNQFVRHTLSLAFLIMTD